MLLSSIIISPNWVVQSSIRISIPTCINYFSVFSTFASFRYFLITILGVISTFTVLLLSFAFSTLVYFYYVTSCFYIGLSFTIHYYIRLSTRSFITLLLYYIISLSLLFQCLRAVFKSQLIIPIAIRVCFRSDREV